LGSPKKPLALVQGHRAPRSAPLARVVECPTPPPGLLKATRVRWQAFFASDVAKAVDLDADWQHLERWIRYVDEWSRVMGAFRRERFVTGSQGQPVLNPLAGYIATLESAISKAEAEFGLGPLSRMRLGIATGEAAMTAQRLNEMTRGEPVDVDGGGEYEPAA